MRTITEIIEHGNRPPVPSDENGNHMRPQKGNSGEKIINTFSREKRLNAMKGFYDQHPYKYFDARWDFYKNNNMLKRWRPWGR